MTPTSDESLFETLEDGGNIALVGVSLVGKSHMLDQIRARLERSGEHTLYADLDSFTSGHELLSALVRSNDKLSIRELWERLSPQSGGIVQPLVLFFDEFDAVRRFPDADEFLRCMRASIHRGRNYGCGVALASRRPIRFIEEKVRGISTLDGVFLSAHVRPMSTDAIASEWGLSLLEAERAFRATAGIPGLIVSGIGTAGDRWAGGERFDHSVAIWARRVVGYFDELGLALALQQYALGPILRPRTLERIELEALGAITASGSANPSLSDFRPFYDEVRVRSLTLEAWGELGRYNLAARAFAFDLLSAVPAFRSGAISVDGADRTSLPRALILALSLATADGLSRPRLSDVIERLPEGGIWECVEHFWGTSEYSPVPNDRLYWRDLLIESGGIGRLPGAVRQPSEESFARKRSRLESRSITAGPTASLPDLSWGTGIRIEATNAVVGNQVHGSIAQSGSGSSSPAGPRWGVIIGIAASILTIAGVILTAVLDVWS